MTADRYPDQYQMTREINRRFARREFTVLIHTMSRFEGVTTTLPQTQTIIDGLGVAGVPADDITVIVALKRGWNQVLADTQPLSLATLKQLNRIVAANDSPAPGELRTGEGAVQITDETFYAPAKVDPQAESRLIADLQTGERGVTARAINLMYHVMRGQLFWDGNKRTAMLAANQMMINGGAGLINMPLTKWAEWQQLIGDYYLSGELTALADWTYANGVIGPKLPPDTLREMGAKLND